MGDITQKGGLADQWAVAIIAVPDFFFRNWMATLFHPFVDPRHRKVGMFNTNMEELDAKTARPALLNKIKF